MNTSPDLAEFPADLISAVARDAADDADQVGHFLQALGLPTRLPNDLLLGLAAGLRLYGWEQAGLRVHLDVGLPPVRQLLCSLFRAAQQPQSEPGSGLTLLSRVLRLFAERFAWNGRSELDADFLLGDVEDDPLIETLADFLWTHRHHKHQELTANEA